MRKMYTAWGETDNISPQMKEILPKIAAGLAADGYYLRTNGNHGVSALFQKGVKGDLYLPFNGFNNKHSQFTDMSSEKLRSVAMTHSHRFGYRNPKTQKIILANIASLVGEDVDCISKFIISYSFDNNKSNYMESIAREFGVFVIEISQMSPTQLQGILREGGDE